MSCNKLRSEGIPLEPIIQALLIFQYEIHVCWQGYKQHQCSKSYLVFEIIPNHIDSCNATMQFVNIQ